jgi:DNA-binding NarL/FixJ family response regulator
VIRVLVVDDHPVVRQGLRAFLGSRSGIEVVGEAADGEAAVAAAADLRPDVVLMDLVMPGTDGLEATRRITAAGGAPAVLVLTSFASDDQVIPAVRAGASGYLRKDVDPVDLEAAIRAVHRGEGLLSPRLVARVMAEVRAGPEDAGLRSLTPREREVLALLAEGRTNRQLAEALTVSEKTVKTHVSSILAKLHLPDRTAAALYAVRGGPVDPG